MKKRWLSMCMALIMCLTLLPAGAGASYNLLDGSDGESGIGSWTQERGSWTAGPHAAGSHSGSGVIYSPTGGELSQFVDMDGTAGEMTFSAWTAGDAYMEVRLYLYDAAGNQVSDTASDNQGHSEWVHHTFSGEIPAGVYGAKVVLSVSDGSGCFDDISLRFESYGGGAEYEPEPEPQPQPKPDPKPQPPAPTGGNLLVNGGAEAGNLSGWVDPDSAWGADDSRASSAPRSGRYLMWPVRETLENTSIYQDVSLPLSSGTITLSGWFCGCSQADHGTMTLELYDRNGNRLSSDSRDNQGDTQTNNWVSRTISRSIPAGAVRARVILTATRYAGSDNDAYFDDFSLTVKEGAAPVSPQPSEQPGLGRRRLTPPLDAFSPSEKSVSGGHWELTRYQFINGVQEGDNNCIASVNRSVIEANEIGLRVEGFYIPTEKWSDLCVQFASPARAYAGGAKLDLGCEITVVCQHPENRDYEQAWAEAYLSTAGYQTTLNRLRKSLQSGETALSGGFTVSASGSNQKVESDSRTLSVKLPVGQRDGETICLRLRAYGRSGGDGAAFMGSVFEYTWVEAAAPVVPPVPGGTTVKDSSGVTVSGTGVTVSPDGKPEVTSGDTGDVTFTVPEQVDVPKGGTVIITQDPDDPSAPSIKGEPGSKVVTGKPGKIFAPYKPIKMVVKDRVGKSVKTLELSMTIKVHFIDVRDNDYYNDPVYWAVKKGITNGTTQITFSPNNTCTQAHIITFLWRSNGAPKVNADVPISGLDKSAYYYPAVQWAYSRQIIDQSFGPQKPCTRAEAVRYMYNNAGRPQVTYRGQFTDMGNTGYEQAVQWALDKGVTKGTTETTFTPFRTCTRGQIVTFLYRALH